MNSPLNNLSLASAQVFLDALNAIPFLNGGVAAVHQEVKEIRRDVLFLLKRRTANEDGWMDASEAARYMGVSKSTFDKYRYRDGLKIEGCPLDGKVLYKRSEIDIFIQTYKSKSGGML